MGNTDWNLPPFCIADLDRRGNVRFYVRKPGQKKIRIREKPNTPEFIAAYTVALAGFKSAVAQGTEGTFTWLCHRYYQSAEFRMLDLSTQNWRMRALRSVCATDGEKPVKLLQPRHVRALRNDLAERPGVANRRLKAMKALFKWAVENGHAEFNPAKEVDQLKTVTKGHHPWSIEEVEAYEQRFPIGTKARLALALMLYTACRREDVPRFSRRNFQGSRVQFVQAKNEHRKPISIDVPLHPDLADVINGTTLVGTDKLLVTDFGKPFTTAGFGNWFRDRCVEAGVPGRAHGLRKALCVRLAEKGATPHEIQAWSGHLTLEEVQEYTEAVNRRRNADAAFVKLMRPASGGTKPE